MLHAPGVCDSRCPVAGVSGYYDATSAGSELLKEQHGPRMAS